MVRTLTLRPLPRNNEKFKALFKALYYSETKTFLIVPGLPRRSLPVSREIHSSPGGATVRLNRHKTETLYFSSGSPASFQPLSPGAKCFTLV
jgi:hypothetical protein